MLIEASTLYRWICLSTVTKCYLLLPGHAPSRGRYRGCGAGDSTSGSGGGGGAGVATTLHSFCCLARKSATARRSRASCWLLRRTFSRHCCMVRSAAGAGCALKNVYSTHTNARVHTSAAQCYTVYSAYVHVHASPVHDIYCT